MAQQPPSAPEPPHYQGFTITLRHATLGRIPLGEWPARLRDLYLTIKNTHELHPCPWRHSYPQSKQARGHRPMP